MLTLRNRPLLQALLRDKVHIRPDALAQLPSAQADRLSSPLALGRLLLRPLENCPAGLLCFWRWHPRGHAVIGPRQHGYQPGPQVVGRQHLDGVAWISPRRLLAEPGLAPPLADLFDHLLGSDGQPGGGRLSEGSGRDPTWQDVAARLQRQFSLGYGPDAAADDPGLYFVWGLRLYLADRQALNVADPGLERLLDSPLFSPEFWG